MLLTQLFSSMPCKNVLFIPIDLLGDHIVCTMTNYIAFEIKCSPKDVTFKILGNWTMELLTVTSIGSIVIDEVIDDPLNGIRRRAFTAIISTFYQMLTVYKHPYINYGK